MTLSSATLRLRGVTPEFASFPIFCPNGVGEEVAVAAQRPLKLIDPLFESCIRKMSGLLLPLYQQRLLFIRGA